MLQGLCSVNVLLFVGHLDIHYEWTNTVNRKYDSKGNTIYKKNLCVCLFI